MKNRGFAMVALDNPKTPANIGSALRACAVFGAAGCVVSGVRYKGSATDTPKAYRHMPLLRVEDVFECIPLDCVPVAVDIIEGSSNLVNYVHPRSAFYVFGAEDATLGQRVLSRCRDVVHIPSAYCLNLAAAVNVILYDRFAKENR